MKKNRWLIVLSLLIVTVLVYFCISIVRSSGSSVESELIDFAIPDVEKIDRIVITDNIGREMDLRLPKGSDKWTDIQGNCITQENVALILDACKKIEFKGYLTDNSVSTHHNTMVSKHIKVDYYLHGKWHKTWYIGPSEKNHTGQIMLLHSKEKGRSDRPVVMAIKGMYGIIEPRFFADPLLWRCSQIFAFSPEEIKKIDVVYPLEPSRSFSVQSNDKKHYQVRQQNIPIPDIDTQIVLVYLNKFKKIHYETANYTLDATQVDSLKQTTPFCQLTVNLNDRSTHRIRMFRIPTEAANLDEFGEAVHYDVDRFWAELPNGEIVKCQYFVFDPLILGHLYFPLNVKR